VVTTGPEVQTANPTPAATTAASTSVSVDATATTAAAAGSTNLTCNSQDGAAGSYDCSVTNPGTAADGLSLFIQADGGQMNGFSASVSLENQGSLLPDPATNLVPLGRFDPSETKTVRVILSCLAATGCKPTTFVVSLWAADGALVVPDSEVRLAAQFPAASP
jgi:hypothetical protein